MFNRQNRATQTDDTGRFWELLRGGHIDQALNLYQTRMASNLANVPRQVRAAYHAHAWLETKADSHVTALQKLSHADPANSQIARAYHLTLQQSAEYHMAKVVATRASHSMLITAPEPLSANASLLLKLGRAVVAALQVYQGEERQYQGDLVLKQLPDKQTLPEAFHELHDNLFVWANWVQNNHAVLFQNQHLLKQMNVMDSDRFLLTATRRWGQQALELGNVGDAVRALEMARKLSGDDTNLLASFVFEWAIEVIGVGASPILEQWFEHPTVASVLLDEQITQELITLILLLDSLSRGQINAGQQYAAQLSNDNSPEGLDAQLLYLEALGALYSALPQDTTNSDNTMNWMAIWRDLRVRVTEVANRLAALEDGWRGHILLGLVSYADRDAIIAEPQLDTYRQSIEKVEAPEIRATLQNIAGILLNRSRATERAIEYIGANDYVRLRELYDEVLLSLGDVVPPLIRATVYMMLWENDPRYNPLPDLKRIPITSDTEALINQCIERVQFLYAVNDVKEQVHNLNTVDNDTPPVSTASVNRHPDALRLFKLAQNMLHLLLGRWDALETIPNNDSVELTQISEYFQFYTLWQQNLYEESSVILRNGNENIYLAPYTALAETVQSRSLVTALERGEYERVSQDLWKYHIIDEVETAEGFSEWLFKIAAWLLHEKRTRALQTLLDVLFEDLAEHQLRKEPMIDWQLNLLSGFVAAQNDKYSLAVDFLDSVLEHEYEVPEDYTMLTVWSRLARIEAEIGGASVTDDINQYWPSMVRTINAHLQHLPDTPRSVLGYRNLLIGMLTFATSNTLVDAATIESLLFAQRILTLQKKETYLNQVLTTLQSRRQMVDDFWDVINNGDFKTANVIFNSQIKVSLQNAVPDSIEMAMVLVDWSLRNASMDDLTRRINRLIQTNPSLNDIGLRLKNTINEHEQIYRLVHLLETGNYDGVVALVATQWQGRYPPNGAEVALLLAYFKKRQTDEALKLLERAANWPLGNYTDYRDLLAGYIYFEREKYEEAGKRFGEIRRKQLANKNTDLYWALTHFQNGMQLLKVGNQEDALKELLIYLRQQRNNPNTIHIELARTLLYFGIGNIRGRSGSHALEAFNHTAEIMDEQRVQNPQAEIFYFLARLGQLITRSLMKDPNIGIVESSEFRALAQDYEASQTYQQQDLKNPNSRFFILYLVTCHKLALGYHIRRTAEATAALTKKQNREFPSIISEDINNLKPLHQALEHNDVPQLILEALLMVRFTKTPKYDDAIELLKLIVNKLGAKTELLTNLIEQIQSEYDTERSHAEEFLTLLDPLLIQADLSATNNQAFIGNETIHRLYRLYRDVTPRELPQLPVKDVLEIMEGRVAHLQQWLESSNVVSQRQAFEYISNLNRQIQQLKSSYQTISEIENNIVESISDKFHQQS